MNASHLEMIQFLIDSMKDAHAGLAAVTNAAQSFISLLEEQKASNEELTPELEVKLIASVTAFSQFSKALVRSVADPSGISAE